MRRSALLPTHLFVVLAVMACVVVGAACSVSACAGPSGSAPGTLLGGGPTQQMEAMISESEDLPRLGERYRALWSRDRLSQLVPGGAPVRRMEAQLRESEDLPLLRQRYSGLWLREEP